MGEVYYHICGYPIIFEVLSQGNGTPAVFRDGGQQGDQEPEIVEVCPNCGEVLLLGDLAPEPADEWW